jgi:hypothetical protein
MSSDTTQRDLIEVRFARSCNLSLTTLLPPTNQISEQNCFDFRPSFFYIFCPFLNQFRQKRIEKEAKWLPILHTTALRGEGIPFSLFQMTMLQSRGMFGFHWDSFWVRDSELSAGLSDWFSFC